MSTCDKKAEGTEQGCSHASENKVETNLKGVKHKIIVMSGKGGVGKSTVAVNLAVSLSMRGYSVGLLDADMHGPSVPKLIGMPPMLLEIIDEKRIMPAIISPSLKVISIALLLRDKDSPIIWRGPLKMGAIKDFLENVEWGSLDYLVVDLPPGTGDEPLSVIQLIPRPDGAIIVTTPQDVALLSVRKSINFAKAMDLRILGMIQNMSFLSCPHCGKSIDVFGNGGVEKAASEMDVEFLGSIPLDPAISKEGDSGTPFVLAKENAAAKAFERMIDRVDNIVTKKK
jgi:ATP-binding protein involved in chromosome partitioning